MNADEVKGIVESGWFEVACSRSASWKACPICFEADSVLGELLRVKSKIVNRKYSIISKEWRHEGEDFRFHVLIRR